MFITPGSVLSQLFWFTVYFKLILIISYQFHKHMTNQEHERQKKLHYFIHTITTLQNQITQAKKNLEQHVNQIHQQDTVQKQQIIKTLEQKHAQLLLQLQQEHETIKNQYTAKTSSLLKSI